MPSAVSLEEELQNLGMAAQQGVITQQEALKAAQELITESQQKPQAAPAIPRALDPAVDAVINQPDKGAHVFDEFIGEGVKAGALGLAAKAGVETILPKMMTNHARDPEFVKEIRDFVLNIDVKAYNKEEAKIIQEVKDYLGKASRGTHKKAHEILDKIAASTLNQSHHQDVHTDIIEAIENKMRVEVTPGAKKVMGAAVAIIALAAAYKGFHEAQEAKKDKLELKQTAAGIQEDYAALHNESGKLRNALEANYNEAAYERELRNQLEKQYSAASYDNNVRSALERQFNAPSASPGSVVEDPSLQGQGLAFSQPSPAASRAELQDYQRKMEAMSASAQPQM